MFAIDPEVEQRQIRRLREIRAGRSADAHRKSLDEVATAARDGSNLVPRILAAVETDATVGEIADTLRGEFGEHRENVDG